MRWLVRILQQDKFGGEPQYHFQGKGDCSAPPPSPTPSKKKSPKKHTSISSLRRKRNTFFRFAISLPPFTKFWLRHWNTNSPRPPPMLHVLSSLPRGAGWFTPGENLLAQGLTYNARQCAVLLDLYRGGSRIF